MKLFLALAFFAIGLTCSAQIQFPDLSPEGKIIQTIGYTHFIIRYERPAARGRKIMGELVPFGKMWRTGAGKCTTLQFDQPVTLGGKLVPAGIYAMATIPSQKEWIVLLNSDTSKIYYQASDNNEKTEVARFSVKAQPTNRFYESLSLDLDIKNNNGILYLSWENTQVSIPIETNAGLVAESRIREALNKNPNDPEALSSIAYYYEMNNLKIPQAYAHIKKAMSLQEDRWYYRQAVNLLVKMKEYKQAIATAQQTISFLERTHPQEWEESVKEYRDDIRKISAMK
jgi:tetratricopeptide (TPR) repeat protein